jgi:hypothetical protein
MFTVQKCTEPKTLNLKTNLLFCWLEFKLQKMSYVTVLADTVFMYGYESILTERSMCACSVGQDI